MGGIFREDIVPATTKAAPPADMQWRAKNISMQASKLASQAGPATKLVVVTARQGADDAAEWAKPWITKIRIWMAAGAARGSVLVQERVAPEVSTMLANAARKLDPPKEKSRRWPKVLAGMSMLAAGGAAAASAAIRNKQAATLTPIPMPPPQGSDTTAQPM